jgi:hypothetical protein
MGKRGREKWRGRRVEMELESCMDLGVEVVCGKGFWGETER